MHDIRQFSFIIRFFVQRLDDIHQISHIVVCLVNTLIHWIVIFLVDSVLSTFLTAKSISDLGSFYHHDDHHIVKYELITDPMRLLLYITDRFAK